jgi:hypothetical protein
MISKRANWNKDKTGSVISSHYSTSVIVEDSCNLANIDVPASLWEWPTSGFNFKDSQWMALENDTESNHHRSKLAKYATKAKEVSEAIKKEQYFLMSPDVVCFVLKTKTWSKFTTWFACEKWEC